MRLTLFVIALLLCGPLPAARATTVIPPDFKTMVHQAEIIFRGKVTNVRSEWSGEGSQRCIVTYITFDVLKVLKGTAASPYVLKQLGGTVDDQTMEIDGAPKFAVGDKTLLFVEHNGTQVVPLVGMMYGYFHLTTDAATGNEIVHKFNGEALHTTAEIDRDHQRAVVSGGTTEVTASVTAAPMKSDNFEAEIKAEAALDK
jgi:hypothetical protein